MRELRPARLQRNDFGLRIGLERGHHSSRLFRLSRVKPEGSVIFFDDGLFKARRFKAAAESIGIHRDQRVMNMQDAHAEALPAIHTREHSARLQHSVDLPQQLVL